MKKLYSIFFLASIFCTTAFAMDTPTKKPVIVTDFDDVWINKSSFLGLLAYLQPIEALFKSKKSTKEITEQPTEKKPRKLGNLPLRLLDYGRRYPRLASYIPGLIEYVGKSRCLNQPIHNLYTYLREEGYTIDIATNKDHMLYDLSIERLGNEIPNMVDKIFVAEPKNDAAAIAQLQAFADKPTTPQNYKNMAHKALGIQETENIIHIPSKKPAKEYFEYVIHQIGPDKDMIFIDDDRENVDAFNALQLHNSRGIVYDQNNPQEFVKELINLGIVSEENNKKLLDDIRYPGIFGQIKLTFKSFFAPKNSTAQTAE